jgi:hypothetical protein
MQEAHRRAAALVLCATPPERTVRAIPAPGRVGSLVTGVIPSTVDPAEAVR